MRVCAIKAKTAVVVVASYRSVSGSHVCFKALFLPFEKNLDLTISGPTETLTIQGFDHK